MFNIAIKIKTNQKHLSYFMLNITTLQEIYKNKRPLYSDEKKYFEQSLSSFSLKCVDGVKQK